MSLETIKAPRRPIDLPRDKPQVEHGEHANLDRPGAVMHPRAQGWREAPRAGGWARYMPSPSWR